MAEAIWARKASEESTRQSRTITVFTVVTIIFVSDAATCTKDMYVRLTQSSCPSHSCRLCLLWTSPASRTTTKATFNIALIGLFLGSVSRCDPWYGSGYLMTSNSWHDCRRSSTFDLACLLCERSLRLVDSTFFCRVQEQTRSIDSHSTDLIARGGLFPYIFHLILFFLPRPFCTDTQEVFSEGNANLVRSYMVTCVSSLSQGNLIPITTIRKLPRRARFSNHFPE